MSTWVQYEWDCETVADGDSADLEDGETIDHAHGATFREVMEWSQRNPAQVGTRHLIVLVRDDDAGRAWAYVEAGRLPQWFSDAGGENHGRVPQRYHAEVTKGLP